MILRNRGKSSGNPADAVSPPEEGAENGDDEFSRCRSDYHSHPGADHVLYSSRRWDDWNKRIGFILINKELSEFIWPLAKESDAETERSSDLIFYGEGMRIVLRFRPFFG